MAQTQDGPASHLPDGRLLQVTPGGELIIAGGAGNGYRFAGLSNASTPSGWADVRKVKTPSGTTLGHIPHKPMKIQLDHIRTTSSI